MPTKTSDNLRPACQSPDVEPEVFYDKEWWPDAAAVCKRCPLAVKLACREAFKDDPYAFAGGMTPGQRRAWKAPKPTVKPKRPGGRPRVYGEEVISDVVRLYKDGSGYGHIATVLGIGKTAVRRIIDQQGVRRTGAEAREFIHKAMTADRGGADTRRLALKLLAEGYTPMQTAELMGVTVQVIYRARKGS